jgi:hypothetical protein
MAEKPALDAVSARLTAALLQWGRTGSIPELRATLLGVLVDLELEN